MRDLNRCVRAPCSWAVKAAAPTPRAATPLGALQGMQVSCWCPQVKSPSHTLKNEAILTTHTTTPPPLHSTPQKKREKEKLLKYCDDSIYAVAVNTGFVTRGLVSGTDADPVWRDYRFLYLWPNTSALCKTAPSDCVIA